MNKQVNNLSSGWVLRRTSCAVLALSSAILLALSLNLKAISFATLYIVTTTSDHNDFNCDNDCTLREAIQAANNTAGDSVINFDIPTTDSGYSNGVWTIKLANPLPPLNTSSGTSKLSISGPGADKLVIFSGTTDIRIFSVTSTGTVTISGLTMREGTTQNAPGGGVYNASTGTVNINNCTLSDNFSKEGGAVYNATTGTININNTLLTRNYANDRGGAVSNNTGTVSISGSTLTENFTNHPPSGYSPALGGAVFSNSGSLNVVDSTLSYNTSGNGGAIYSNGSATTVSRSTLNANFADTSGFEQGGGGIFIEGGTTSVVNSTLYGNGVLTFFGGGGGAILTDLGTLNLTNSTVVNNSVFGRETEGGGGLLNNGGVHIKSTIIALNSAQASPIYTASGAAGPDVQGFVSSSGFNLIGKKDGSTGFTAATDKKGTIASPLNPKFDGRGLRNNGGPTQTIALVSGSPAIDKGTSAGLTGTLTTDQRGLHRTVDNSSIANATGGDGTDIGAFEFGAQ